MAVSLSDMFLIFNRDLEKTREGWEKYYWDAMKRTFGFGSMML
jgi:hypothetical protein